jgi:hypothetical protein
MPGKQEARERRGWDAYRLRRRGKRLPDEDESSSGYAFRDLAFFLVAIGIKIHTFEKSESGCLGIPQGDL